MFFQDNAQVVKSVMLANALSTWYWVHYTSLPKEVLSKIVVKEVGNAEPTKFPLMWERNRNARVCKEFWIGNDLIMELDEDIYLI